ncbi:TPA_asm: hypothetical protein GEH29_02175 [Listeria monocytogenes]|uniref:DUF2786 domain-containing protein n=1 Tax=Listeria TaxID=1637 RepID=UPI00070D29D8|nr:MULTISPECIES: DUF2786 domain-containing protein [Listeria]EAE2532706.1 DUF2786 domain-containing protein [Listeria monocytogenes]EAF2996463.1 DUF2786 domain-containing protein [Listeria monocytogenes]EAF8351948.1 DUF2786 domain-containing protein [Listeria monocytogenes]EBA3686283.1 DUF2786 domain-containing protein [Listeria monocytogenes]EBA3711174.1 DUF2786 domain-containing protein [Listeria monocytogenes]
MENEKIIRKVKRLLALARENKSDEEGQSAFMLAQRLMLQNNISENELKETEATSDLITESSVTIHKRLFWWEKELGDIIARNFRVKMFFKVKMVNDIRKKSITFFGIDKDLELAKEMFLLAYETVLFHSRIFIDKCYRTSGDKRTRYVTESIKASYIKGFLEGINDKFEKQISILRNEYEVLVLVPEEVTKKYQERSKKFGKIANNIPDVKVVGAYADGYNDGKSIDFTKRTISGNGVAEND